MMQEEYISDSEIRVIGGGNTPPKKPFPWLLVVLMSVLIAIIACTVWLLWPAIHPTTDNNGVFEPEIIVEQPHPLRDWLTALDTINVCATATHDVTVNDIPLRVYNPLNSTPYLEIGYGVVQHPRENILFFQAADVRADNQKIVGAFVLKGKPLSWGLSKRGYCAIVNGKVTVGVADNSPLFEQATEQNGYFFRQYPLVYNGTLVESELKNKSIRRALCDIDSHIVVVESQSLESMHDFAQALVDLGTTNAIYLVGSSAMGWCLDIDGNGTKMGLWDARAFKNISFIVWPLKNERVNE